MRHDSDGLIDVSLQFDAKYRIPQITIADVKFDPAQGGYPVPVSSFAPQIATALGRYFAPNGASGPLSLSATTELTFRSSTHMFPEISAKTTSNNFIIQWMKTATAAPGALKAGS